MKTLSVVGECYMIEKRCFLSLCVGLLSAAITSCSVYVDSSRKQCVADSDCAAHGEAFTGATCVDSACQSKPDPIWGCLDHPDPGDVATTDVHVNLRVIDLLSQKPLTGIGLSVCNKIDGDCSIPLSLTYSDGSGMIDVLMPLNFQGYFEAKDPGVYPTLIFPPNTNKQRTPSTLPLTPAAFFGTMFANVGVSAVDEDRSVVLLTALDCQGRPAAGMSFYTSKADNDPMVVPYVLTKGLPDRNAQVTDESGVGGFVNIKPGTVVITATIAATGRVAGTVAIQARPKYISMVLVTPTGG